MSVAEPASHTFLVRIWIEETVEEAAHLVWRGHITHLPDEQRSYVKTFEDIVRFIQRHVAGGLGPPAAATDPSEGTQPGRRHE
ncbi:MAG TPA: hypothetical protein VM324_10150 [Egibacteraceae bacterium]|nr:hypothetical protein [Egibacteraceae bacterium]